MVANAAAWLVLVLGAYFIARRNGLLLLLWAVLALATLGPILERAGVIPAVPVVTEP